MHTAILCDIFSHLRGFIGGASYFTSACGKAVSWKDFFFSLLPVEFNINHWPKYVLRILFFPLRAFLILAL